MRRRRRPPRRSRDWPAHSGNTTHTLKKKNRVSFPIPILKTMHYVCFGLVFNQFKTVAAATRLHYSTSIRSMHRFEFEETFR